MIVTEERNTLLKLIFITPCVVEDFFLPVKKAAAMAAEIFGVSVEFVGTEDVDIEEQVGLIEKALAEGYDGIALSMPHDKAFNDIVARALAKNVPVVAFNVDSKDPANKRLAAVAQNLFEAGRAAGLRAARHIRTGAKVLFTQHSENVSALDDRMSGMLESLQNKNIRHEVIITGMFAREAGEVITRKLQDDEGISAILCTGQADTEGAGLAKASFPNRELFVAGFDLSSGILEMVQQGVIDFTVEQQPFAQGFYPVAQLVLYLRYGIAPMNMDTGAAIIDTENVGSAMKAVAEGFR